MSETVLEIRDLSKLYRLGEVGTGTLSHDLNRWWARIRGKDDPLAVVGQKNLREQRADSQYVWALKDVSLDLARGEVLGVIGSNGAGKSTLLKLISRITSPTTGRIRAKGRIASLLEVGTGMHPEMTARENIYLNGAILGMRRQEITRKFDDIIDFAGCRMYVDTPVKRFSSGMRVRLGFAVAAFLEPEILIVDEVLAVADVAFQKQCLGRMRDLSSRSGRTVVFVSHNSTALASLCQRGILLKHGTLAYDGTVQEALHHYNECHSERRVSWDGPSGDHELQLVRAWARPPGGSDVWDTGKPIEVGAVIDVFSPVDGLYFGFRLLSDYGDELGLTLFDDCESGLGETLPAGRYTQTWMIPANTLGTGRYRLAFVLGLAYVREVHRDPMGELLIELENFTGIGRRFPVKGARGFDSIFRPDWSNERHFTPLPGLTP